MYFRGVKNGFFKPCLYFSLTNDYIKAKNCKNFSSKIEYVTYSRLFNGRILYKRFTKIYIINININKYNLNSLKQIKPKHTVCLID